MRLSKNPGASRLAAAALLGCLALLIGAPCADMPPTVVFVGAIANPVYSAPTTCGTCSYAIGWKASDDISPAEKLIINLYLSLDGGTTWKAIAVNLSNPELTSGAPTEASFAWYPPDLPTAGATAIVRVEAVDQTGNAGTADSNQFQLRRSLGLAGTTTLRDFFMPGSQPGHHMVTFDTGANGRRYGTQILDVSGSSSCRGCHRTSSGNPNETNGAPISMYQNWEGTLMANASYDPLFKACLEIATADAPESGDLCLRCHLPRAWLNGRSTPTDGSAVELDPATASADKQGVSCEICHRMVDPGSTDAGDVAILNDLDKGTGGDHKPIEGGQPVYGNGMYVLDRDLNTTGAAMPAGSFETRRGPYPQLMTDKIKTPADHGHTMKESEFFRSAALCGTCHDVSNPQLDVKNVNGTWSASADDGKAPSFKPSALMPIERTYSEWLASDFPTTGVASLPFGVPTATEVVKTCQDCHMRDVDVDGLNPATAKACGKGAQRNDLGIHDLTGGNAWIPLVLKDPSFGIDSGVYPSLDRAASGARYMLRHAATVTLAELTGPPRLEVKIQNESGHKLPTGYPEGRRMWINVKFLDDKGNVLRESNRYDRASGYLDTSDSESKVYEAKLIDAVGAKFHFVTANKVEKDNRIPPRGYKKAQLAAAEGGPVPASLYADGQSDDTAVYTVPACASTAQVRVLYQTSSREYIEFLRDANPMPGGGAGQVLYDLWKAYDRSPPVDVGWTSETAGAPDPKTIYFSDPGISDPQLCKVVSRKTHAAQGPFDIDVLSGGAEPRRTGTEKRLTLIAYFDQTLKGGGDLGTATVQAGAATVESRTLSADQREVTLQLKDVADEQCLSLKLTGFQSVGGTAVADRTFTFPVLLGDVSVTHEDPSPTTFSVTTARDVNDAKDSSGVLASPDNFRQDVNLSGGITAADVSLVTSRVGKVVSCSP